MIQIMALCKPELMCSYESMKTFLWMILLANSPFGFPNLAVSVESVETFIIKVVIQFRNINFGNKTLNNN